jgi:hypothetical protein
MFPVISHSSAYLSEVIDTLIQSQMNFLVIPTVPFHMPSPCVIHGYREKKMFAQLQLHESFEQQLLANLRLGGIVA